MEFSESTVKKFSSTGECPYCGGVATRVVDKVYYIDSEIQVQHHCSECKEQWLTLHELVAMKPGLFSGSSEIPFVYQTQAHRNIHWPGGKLRDQSLEEN